MLNTTFSAILDRYPSAAQCAAALGISRQAMSAAIKRGRLSEALTLKASALLDTDPGAALLERARSAPHHAEQRDIPNDLHYVKFAVQQKSDHGTTKKNNIHSITSKEQAAAVEIVKWCLAVAKLPADSPRFAWYVSRWNVPEKIARAKAAGTLDALLIHCPPIDPAWVRFVPAALEAHRQFVAAHTRPITGRPKSSGMNARAA